MRAPRIVAARAPMALLTAVYLVVSPAAPLFAVQIPVPLPPKATPAPKAGPPAPKATPAPPPQAAPAPKAAAAPPPVDGGWPRAYATPSGGHVIVYQPQVATWAEQKRIVAYAAVSFEAKGAPKPALGSVKIEPIRRWPHPRDSSTFKLRSPNQLPTLPRADARVAERIARRSRRGPRDRSLRVLASRQEPDRTAERGRREGGPAGDLLQRHRRPPPVTSTASRSGAPSPGTT